MVPPRRILTLRSGFTLVELCLVIAIIGILDTLAVPQFAMLMGKANEAQTKSNLATLRSALSIYFSDNAAFPNSIDNFSLGGKYLQAIPQAFLPGLHPTTSASLGGVFTFTSGDACVNYAPTDVGGWLYLSPGGTFTVNGNTYYICNLGSIFVSCLHPDSRGITWISY
jgi:prepilin-type N-terminal cleavage/methylation domain-containing protein